MIASPYTKLLCSQWNVDQAAALLICSVEAAERLGIAEETLSRWINGLQIQTRAMDNWLRAFFGFPVVRGAFCGATQDPQLGTTDVSAVSR